MKQTEAILQQGRALILLDGLDEVREIDLDWVLQEIDEFSTQFHKCLFVMTCRIAAREYTFEQFTEVEIADFDDQQVIHFVNQWFQAKNDSEKTTQLLKKLRDHQRIGDLARNPLLLTLLCLVFQESADFPVNRCELYREGLEVLLKTWDAKRNIERDRLYLQGELYRSLSLQRKEALLSQIAFMTFERGEYFFKQQAVERYIAEFLRTLPCLNHKLEPLEIDSKAVLKSIEAQHGLLVERVRGIYSFSHLTFHEYFTARRIANSSETQLEEALQALASHVFDEEWHEVFLLTASMLQRADDLLFLMKAQIDQLLSSDATLQQFLSWLNERAILAIKNGSIYKPALTRAYHSFLVFDHVNIKANAVAIASVLNRTSEIDNSAKDISSPVHDQRTISDIVSSAGDNQRAIAIAIVISSSMSSVLEAAIDRNIIISSAVDKAI
ncbi:MAG TPA: signal transduction protein, partial [Allocoleopsis sp.]